MTILDEPTLPDLSPDGPDSEAPWGRRADGTPRAKPGAKPGAKPAGPRKAAAPGPRKAAGAARKPAGVDYRPALMGLGHLPVGIVSMAAKLIRDDRRRTAVQLDAITVKVHLPGVAEAVNDIAQENAKVANALDRIVSVGPYGAVIAAVAPILLQCLVNHGQMDPNPSMGLLSADQLLAAVA